MSDTISDNLNFLGRFDTLDEVYAAYPSGGVPGNFVIVDDVVLYWNEDTLTWANREGESSGDTVVDGTLTVNDVVLNDGFRTSDFVEDTQGSALRNEDGQWLFSTDNINVRGSITINGEEVTPGNKGDNNQPQGIHAQLIVGSDSVTIDAFGNVVGGLFAHDGDVITYKLHTGVLVYDVAKGRYLSVAADNGKIGENEFALYVAANGCSVLRDGADVYVTSIANTANGNLLTDAQLETMRNTNGFSVDFVVVTANGWRTQMTYPVRIIHLEQGFVTFDLTNEADSFGYRTQTKRYDGLPVSTSIKGYVNGQEADIVSVSATSDFWGGTTLTADSTHAGFVEFYGGSVQNSCGIKAVFNKNGTLTLDHTRSTGDEVDTPDTKHEFSLSCVVKYAGVSYTSPIYKFVVGKTTDTTLYKLLLSANAVLREEGVHTPSSIDVKVQAFTPTGTIVGIPDAAADGIVKVNNAALGNIYVKYLSTTYDPTWNTSTLAANWGSVMPAFTDVPTCITVLLVDLTDPSEPVILDVESVPMTAKGKDGAGQPWVKLSPDYIVIDCESNGAIKTTKQINFQAQLYWGDNVCTLNTSNCGISLPNEESVAFTSFSNNGTKANRSYTFTQGATLSSMAIPVSLEGTYTDEDGNTTTHSATASIPVFANLQGVPGAKGDAGASIIFAGDWLSTESYLWNENIRHAVRHNGTYWFVNTASDGTMPLGEPDTENTNWTNVGNLKIVATELLFAENGTINLFGSNVINLFNGARKTASINEDGNGNYCIFYPSGNKLLELKFDGYLHGYRDDDGNSEAWKLGGEGDIDKFDIPSWSEISLYKLGEGSLTWGEEAVLNDMFALTDYWQFHSGNDGTLSQYDGKVCLYGSGTPSNIATATAAPDGWYTPDGEMYQFTTGEINGYARTVYHIVSGKIVQEKEVTTNLT